MCFVSTIQYKESPCGAGFIFGDLCLIFLWQGTKDGCIYWVILCVIYPPVKLHWGQESYSHSAERNCVYSISWYLQRKNKFLSGRSILAKCI